jgi:hypothetical protein
LYLRELAHTHQCTFAQAAKIDSELGAAHRLYEHSAPTGLLVEARLLMGEDSAQIARLTGIPAPVVDAYEAVFFNCRDRLHAADWVVCCALGTPPSAASIGPDKGAALKRFAFFGGPLVLDAVQPYLLGGEDLFDPPLDLSTIEGRREQIIRLAVAVHLLPNDAATQWKLQKIMLLVQERELQREKQRRETALGTQSRALEGLWHMFEAATRLTQPTATPPTSPEVALVQTARAG